MSEFDAFNRHTGEWETFPLSKLTKIERNRIYKNIAVNPECI